MHAFSTTIILIGVAFILLGVGVLIHPPLLVGLASALSIIVGIYITVWGMRLKKFTRSFQDLKDRFFISR